MSSRRHDDDDENNNDDHDNTTHPLDNQRNDPNHNQRISAAAADDDDDPDQHAMPPPATVSVHNNNNNNIHHKSNKRRRRSRAKLKRPPGFPMRPLNAYNFFFKEERMRFLDQYPEGSEELLQMGTLIGVRWKNLSSEERQKYEVMSENDKNRYQRELGQYNSRLMRTSSSLSKSVSSTTRKHPPVMRAAARPQPNSEMAEQQQQPQQKPQRHSSGSLPSLSQTSSISRSTGPSLPPSFRPSPVSRTVRTTRTASTSTPLPHTANSVLYGLLRQFVVQLNQQQPAGLTQPQAATTGWIENQTLQLLLALNDDASSSAFLAPETASLLRQLERVQELMAQLNGEY